MGASIITPIRQGLDAIPYLPLQIKVAVIMIIISFLIVDKSSKPIKKWSTRLIYAFVLYSFAMYWLQ